MKIIKIALIFCCTITTLAVAAKANNLAKNYQEKNGVVVIEAEDFSAQHLDTKRRWFTFSTNTPQHNYPDNDYNHALNASNGSYIELLPDTRTNHVETLVRGENFTDIPGTAAVLTYPVYFKTAGTYYVWARAYSTGSEDNGVHFGLNGTWPESAQRLQLCENKHQWTWSSAQRTKENHCGIANTITLNIPQPGVHTIMVSMREDGFELDKFLLTQDKTYQPQGLDLAATTVEKSALAEKETLKGITQYKKLLRAIDDFTIENTGTIPFYQHKAKQALAINAVKTEYRNKYAFAEYIVTAKDAGTHQLTLVTLSEIDGECPYQILLNNKVIARFTNPETEVDYQEVYFNIDNVTLKKGDVLKVASMAVTNGKIPENGGTAFARGRWRALAIGTQQ